MKKLTYLLTHISVQLRLVAFFSCSIFFFFGVLLGFFTWYGLIVGALIGLFVGGIFWFETRTTLHGEGPFPVTYAQKIFYIGLFFMYAVFIGCLVEQVPHVRSHPYVEAFLGDALFGSLGFLLVLSLVQLVRLSVHAIKGGVLDLFVWRDRQTGKEGMVGLNGVVTEAIHPEGMIRVRGELWQAVQEDAEEDGKGLEPGDKVIVVGINGLLLKVRPRKAVIPGSRAHTGNFLMEKDELL